MARNRFVSAETVRLELTDGDWIEVKRELSYGEQQELFLRDVQMTGLAGGERNVSVDLQLINIRDMAMWIVDWSFEDAKGKRVPVSIDSIKALATDAAEEVDEALTAYKLSLEKNAVTSAPSTK
jgi:hypothetical protein